MIVVFDRPDVDAPESISLAELAAVKPPKAVVAVATKAPAPRKSERNRRRDRLRRLKATPWRRSPARPRAAAADDNKQAGNPFPTSAGRGCLGS